MTVEPEAAPITPERPPLAGRIKARLHWLALGLWIVALAVAIFPLIAH